jgi:hypothetical protein
MRSEVLLFKPSRLTDRKNGDRRLYGITGKSRLNVVCLAMAAEAPPQAYRGQFLLTVENFGVHVLRCLGTSPTVAPRSGDSLLLLQSGAILMETDLEDMPLLSGYLVKIPKHTAFRLIADRPSIALELVRESPSASQGSADNRTMDYTV